jgi:hypothetical protein
VERVHPGFYADWHTPGEKAAAADAGTTLAPAAGTSTATPAEVK